MFDDAITIFPFDCLSIVDMARTRRVVGVGSGCTHIENGLEIQ